MKLPVDTYPYVPREVTTAASASAAETAGMSRMTLGYGLRHCGNSSLVSFARVLTAYRTNLAAADTWYPFATWGGASGEFGLPHLWSPGQSAIRCRLRILVKEALPVQVRVKCGTLIDACVTSYSTAIPVTGWERPKGADWEYADQLSDEPMTRLVATVTCDVVPDTPPANRTVLLTPQVSSLSDPDGTYGVMRYLEGYRIYLESMSACDVLDMGAFGQ